MPAKDNFFTRFRNSAVQKVNHFLYGDRDSGYGYSSGAVYDVGDPPYEPEEQRAPRRRRGQYREERYAQDEQRMNEQQQQMYQQQAYQQQAPYPQGYQQQGYQQGYQQPYQQQPQQAYQQPVTQFAAQVEEQRSRNPQAQQPDPQKVVPFPGSYSGEQPQDVKPASVRVITIRGFNDCRSAISYLRAGEILLVVMDGIQDQAEMRRYVDMMAGACFSLSASITKVSRYGSYLAAPGQVSVWADPVISQMNGTGRRAARPAQPQNSYRTYQGDYQQGAAQGYGYQEPAPQNAYHPYAPNVQNAAADGTEFYARQPQPTPEQPPFEAQERGTGYAPDHEAEAL